MARDQAHLALHCCEVLPDRLRATSLNIRNTLDFKSGFAKTCLPVSNVARQSILSPPCSALLCSPARQAACNAAPLTAIDQKLIMQPCVFFISPGFPGDCRVQVAFPAPHALLISTPLKMAGNLRPAPAMFLVQLQQLLIFSGRPLLLLDVGVHLRTQHKTEAKFRKPV